MTYKGPAEDALYAPDPFRSSDHDPVIIGLALDSVAPQIDIELSPPSSGRRTTSTSR